jgi:hypothetical protein
MNRKSNFTIGIVGVCCVTFLALAAAQSFGAVTNGFFDTSLLDWQYNDSSGVSWSSTGFYDEAGNGTALLQQFPPDSTLGLPTSVLSQTFHVDTYSSSLTFQVRTPLPIYTETDHFYIQLLNSAEYPILGNLGNDYFFHWKSGQEFDGDDAGWLASETPAGVSVQVDSLMDTNDQNFANLYSFVIPIDTDWYESDVTLRFKLQNDYTDASETSILIDNVVLNVPSNPPVVPIPGAMGLAISGLAAMGVFARKLA